MTSLYSLSDGAQAAWKRWLKAELQRRSSSQQALAIEIFGLREDGEPSNTTEVNRFVAGEGAILRRWFEEHPERAQRVAEELDLSVEQLQDKLVSFAGGETRAAPWHPAFPTVPLADALIPTPLDAVRGATPEEVARDFAARLLGPEQWEEGTRFKDRLTLTAAGSVSRSIAAEQLRAALEGALDERRTHSIQKAAEHQKALNPPRVSVVVAGPGVVERPLTVIVEVREPPAEPGLFDAPLRLGEWGPEQGVALARRLAESAALEPRARATLATFAERLEERPGWTSPVLEPDLLIRWLAEVARSACPEDGEQARGLLTAAAWRRAQAAASPLAEFEEELLDVVFGELAARERPAGALGPWTRAPRSVLLAVLERAAEVSLGGVSREKLLKLVDSLGQPGRGSKKRKAALRQAIVAPSPAVLLDALTDAGVLRETWGGTLEAAEPELAAAHAARHLRHAMLFSTHPELLVDPHGAYLADELARHGVSWTAFKRATATAPPYLAVDVAHLRLRFAWCADVGLPGQDLTAAWASLLWASSHGFLALAPSSSRDPWPRATRALLKQVSWRFRQALPLLGLDPVEELRALVPEATQELVQRWRRTPHEGEPDWQANNRALMGLELRELGSRAQLAGLIRSLAPSQVHPAKCWEIARWMAVRVPVVTRLQEVALAGDQDAVDLLTGRAWLTEQARLRSATDGSGHDRKDYPAIDCWTHLPASVRLAWALRAGPRGDEGWEIYVSILDALKLPKGEGEGQLLGRDHRHFEELVRLGASLDSQLLVNHLVYRFTPGGFSLRKWFPWELAWALAERLELRGLLQSLVNWPTIAVPRLRVTTCEDGFRLTWGPGEQYIALKSSWSSSASDGSEEVRQRWAVPRLGVEGIVAGWRAIAMRAATTLCKLGEPEPLFTLWRAKEAVLPSSSLMRQVQALEGFLGVIDAPDSWGREGFPINALGDIAPGEVVDREHAHMMDGMLRHALGLRRGEGLSYAWDPWRAPEIRRAFLGLWSLARRDWEEWPELVVSWLSEIFGPGVRYMGGEQSHRVLEQAQLAAQALLSCGQVEPLRLWVEGQHEASPSDEGSKPEDERPTSFARGTAWAVKAWWREDRSRLDELWALVEAQDYAAPEVRLQLRHTLLREGSYREGWKEDTPTREGCPRPFVIRAAMDNPELADWHHHYNWQSPKWSAVLRCQLAKATDARSRAGWAARLAKTEPGCVELQEALRHWLLDDPTPWAGPLEWEGPDDKGRFVGGTLELLDLALSMKEEWVTRGLERLWRDGLRRPWLDSFCGHEAPEAEDGWWSATAGFGATPGVVRKLVDALVERGRAEVVVEAWPPTSEDLDCEPSRPFKLRLWLRRVAPALAPNGLLIERVEDWIASPGARPFPMEEAWELCEREYSDIEVIARAMAERLELPNFAMLARANPGELLELGRGRIAAGDDARYVLLHMLAEMSERGGEAPMELVEARAMILEMLEGRG